VARWLNFCFQNRRFEPENFTSKAQEKQKLEIENFCSALLSSTGFFLAKKKPKEAKIFRNDKKANKAIAEEEKEAKNVSR
jgi:hypothetical protein